MLDTGHTFEKVGGFFFGGVDINCVGEKEKEGGKNRRVTLAFNA